MRPTGDSHIILLNQGKKETILFFVPGAGGRSEECHQVARAFKGSCTVYGITMLGIENGEKPLRGVRQIAAKNIDWIRTVQEVGPYSFVGYSFGANVAYEMTRQLEETGEKVHSLFILDTSAGLNSRSADQEKQVDYVLSLTADYFGSGDILREPYPHWVYSLRSALLSVPIIDMLPYIADFIKSKLPEKKIGIDFMSNLLNVRINNEQLSYQPIGKIDAELVVIKAEDTLRKFQDETLGWGHHADNSCVFSVPGDHYGMLRGENALNVARCIEEKYLKFTDSTNKLINQ
jgi:thioesterase domain-containing protein